jgi:hypothetical protein
VRLWSIHPKYLDPQGLVACWREALLARAVLRNETRGYRNHPQLDRFRAAERPLAALEVYLWELWEEGTRRGYRFDVDKLGERLPVARLPVTDGQLVYELAHLKAKLASRAPQWHEKLAGVALPDPHPLFIATSGNVELWERPPVTHY